VVVDQPLGERIENAAVAAYSGDPNNKLDGIESRVLVAKGWGRSLVDGLQGLAQDPFGIIRDPAILGYDQIQTAFYFGTDGLLGDPNSVVRNDERTESLYNFVEAAKTSTNDPEKAGYLFGGAILGLKKGKLPGPNSKLKGVVDGHRESDIAKGAIVDGKYVKNPTAQNLTDVLTPGGRVFDKSSTGRFVYVVDDSGNFIIGNRARSSEFPSGLPHPTLIGGADPKVLGAGELYLKGGKITWINDKSGHFQQANSLNAAKSAIENLPKNVLHKGFKGYLSHELFPTDEIPKAFR
jgi:hypothetical protein